MSNDKFAIEAQKETLQKLAEYALDIAKKYGATQAEVSLSKGAGLSVEVQKSDVDNLEYHRDQSFRIGVYNGYRQASSTSNDLSLSSIKDCVIAACNIVKFTEEDSCAGLADASMMATQKDLSRDLDLYHPWNISTEDAITLTQECEAAGFDQDSRIINSDGASFSSYEGLSLYANSHGFMGEIPSTRHSLSCSLIAQNTGEEQMQRDYWYDVSRNASSLISANSIGQKAAQAALKRLGAQQISTREVPVLFSPHLARSLIGHLKGAIGGGSQYRKASFLLDAKGQQVLPEFFNLREQPFIVQGLGSRNYDSEGVATKEKDIIKAGQIETYLLGSYSARKLGLQSTANSGGTYNLTLDPAGEGSNDLIKQMGTGLLLSELIGSGVNGITGDYSRGAAGYWVENGEIQYPVEEITIAGNLKTMFKGIVGIGDDIDYRSSTRTGSILIDNMMIAGS